MGSEPTRKFDPSDRRRPRRLEDAKTEEISFPLAWLIIGGLAGLIVIGLVGLGVVNIFRQQAITPTPQSAPPLVQPVNTPTPEEAVVAATATPTPDPAPVEGEGTPPEGEGDQPAEGGATTDQIQINDYVRVVGTGGVGVSMRADPGRNNARVLIAEEDESVRLLVLDGPREDENAEDYTWWFVRHPDGTEGWVVSDFIGPVPAPAE